MSIRHAAMCGLLWCSAWAVAAPADMPAGSTGLCKDGSYSNAVAKRGACRGHKGVKDWYAASAASAVTPSGPKATSTSTTAAIPSAAPQVAPVMAPTATKPAATATSGRSMTPVSAAAGGGPGMVWVNADTKVYHCSGDRWYGKTKQGSYMSEAEAKTQGVKPSHGKACT